MSFMALDGVMLFLCLKGVTNKSKRVRLSLIIDGSSSVQWWNVGRSWRLQMCFCRLLCVEIEIDQLQCLNCWVIIHCLSVSCTKINHSRCTLVIWSSLQPTSKQWIITQQFTARAMSNLDESSQFTHFIILVPSCGVHPNFLCVFLGLVFTSKGNKENCPASKHEIRWFLILSWRNSILLGSYPKQMQQCLLLQKVHSPRTHVVVGKSLYLLWQPYLHISI